MMRLMLTGGISWTLAVRVCGTENQVAGAQMMARTLNLHAADALPPDAALPVQVARYLLAQHVWL